LWSARARSSSASALVSASRGPRLRVVPQAPPELGQRHLEPESTSARSRRADHDGVRAARRATRSASRSPTRPSSSSSGRARTRAPHQLLRFGQRAAQGPRIPDTGLTQRPEEPYPERFWYRASEPPPHMGHGRYRVVAPARLLRRAEIALPRAGPIHHFSRRPPTGAAPSSAPSAAGALEGDANAPVLDVDVTHEKTRRGSAKRPRPRRHSLPAPRPYGERRCD
jgi:hypothetical protein